MITTVNKYYNYLSNLNQLITDSDYKASYFYKKLNLKAPTYYRKLRENSFTTEEVVEITKLLFPEEAYREEIKRDLKLAESDIENGRVRTNSSVMEELEKEFTYTKL